MEDCKAKDLMPVVKRKISLIFLKMVDGEFKIIKEEEVIKQPGKYKQSKYEEQKQQAIKKAKEEGLDAIILTIAKPSLDYDENGELMCCGGDWTSNFIWRKDKD